MIDNSNGEEKKISRQVQRIISNGTVITFVLLVTGIIVMYYFAQALTHSWSKPSPVRVTDEQLEYILDGQ